MNPRTFSVLLVVSSLLVAIALPALANDDGAAAGAPPEDLLERTSAGEELEAGFGAQVQSGSDVVISGGGWGHGIGMPQWGAQAMAQAGHSHEAILKHFYTGAQVGGIKDVVQGGTIVQHANPIHVGLASSRTSDTFQALGGNLQVCLGSDCHTATPGQTWGVSRSNDTCRLHRDGDLVSQTGCSNPAGGQPGQVVGTITWVNQPGTKVQFTSFSDDRTYARGSVRFTAASNGTFHLTALLNMQEYLYGLAEVPNSWHAQALRAQVVAARTFALYRIWVVARPGTVHPGGLMASCACQLRSTTADQAYRGWEAKPGSGMTEGDPNNGHLWKQAVDQTSGKALWHSMHGSQRALEAYYFSSTGHRTENNEDRWGGSPYAYLRSTTDAGPRPWPAVKGYTYAGFRSALNNYLQILGHPQFSTINWVEIAERYASGRPKRIEVQGVAGGTHQTRNLSSGQFLAAFGLHSQWIWSITGFVPPGADRVVLHNPTTGQWSYRNSDGTLSTIFYGNPGDRAFMGDWNCNGLATPGLYRQSDGYVYLRNSNTQGIANITFFFGNPGDIPIVGDFNGDGCDTVSIYRPSQARFYIINKLGSADKGLGAADYSYVFGNPGDVPFVGDWNGNGIDTPGLRRPSDGFVYLRNTNSQGVAHISFFYGNAGDVVFAGDWNANGRDSIGLYRPSNGTVYLRNNLSTGVADITYQMGGSSHRAVAGKY